MKWNELAEATGVSWWVEEDPRLFAKIYKFKKDGLRIDYYIEHSTFLRNPETAIEVELLRVVRELNSEVRRVGNEEA